MKEFFKTLDKVLSNNLVKSGIIIIVSLILYRIISNILLNKTKKIKVVDSNRGQTYIKLANSVLKYAFIIITFIIVLQTNNINVTSMIAGLGLVGAGIVLAVQDALKDIIRGFSIISDSYFKVGDIVKYGDIEGKVLILGLKSTKIKSLATGNVVSVANRNIEQIEVVSNNIYFNIPLSYELKQSKVDKVLMEIVDSIKRIDNIKECNYLGPNNLNDSSIDYLIGIELDNNEKKRQSRRDIIKEVLLVLEKNNIEIPYNQLDIHNK